MIMDFYFMQYVVLEYAELVSNKAFVYLYHDFV